MPDLKTLLDLFYEDSAQCGLFARVSGEDMPAVYNGLLNHDNHMTVTVEAFHGSLVDVEVLETRTSGDHYSRKIVLSRRSDGKNVQYGIVRLNTSLLKDDVRDEIKSCVEPLGRVLIRHNVMRRVELVSLWRVEPGPELQSLFGSDQITYGRTALIHVNHEPAVELFEIVSPVANP
ncbi:MAG: hypothetical protein KDA60_15630 [Planctomycetales bacterium]|nr:hypothetical protein [Planctomycetales bacterium]